MFLFRISNAVPATTLEWSIPLLFLFSYVFYIHPIGHFSSCLLPLCQSEPKYKIILKTSVFRYINSFLCQRFHTKTRFETEAKGNIHTWPAHRSLWICLFVCFFFSGGHERTVRVTLKRRMPSWSSRPSNRRNSPILLSSGSNEKWHFGAR